MFYQEEERGLHRRRRKERARAGRELINPGSLVERFDVRRASGGALGNDVRSKLIDFVRLRERIKVCGPSFRYPRAV